MIGTCISSASDIGYPIEGFCEGLYGCGVLFKFDWQVCLSELLVFHHYKFFAYVVTNWMKLCIRWNGWTRLWKSFGRTLTRLVLADLLAQNIHMPWSKVKWVYILNSPCIRQLESLSRGKCNQFWINMQWVWFSELSCKLWLLAPKLHI